MPPAPVAYSAIASRERNCAAMTSPPVPRMPFSRLRRLTFSIMARLTNLEFFISGPLRGGGLDRRENTLITSAAADISRHRLIDVVVGGLALLGDQRGGVHDLAGLTVPALRYIFSAP